MLFTNYGVWYSCPIDREGNKIFASTAANAMAGIGC